MPASAVMFLCLLGMAITMQATAAWAQQPSDVSACRIPRGGALAAETDRQRAIEACSRVIADAAVPASIRADALLTRVSLYEWSAEMDLRTAVEIDPTNTAVRKRRGHYHSTSGRFERAIADYNEAIRMDPSDAEAYSGRGDAWLGQKRYSEAIADFRKAGELKPIDPSRARDTCRITASWQAMIFYCTLVAYDVNQPAEIRAEALRRLPRHD